MFKVFLYPPPPSASRASSAARQILGLFDNLHCPHFYDQLPYANSTRTAVNPNCAQQADRQLCNPRKLWDAFAVKVTFRGEETEEDPFLALRF